MAFKQSLLPFFLFLLFVSCQQMNEPMNGPVELNLWPVADADSSTEQVLPSRGDDVIRITDVNHPSMTVYPAEGDGNRPAVLIFPGGAYAYMAINKEGTKVADWLNSLGITSIVVKYTVPDDRTAAFRDGRRALRLVRHHAQQWNIDPARVGVMGFSAGGHLSARLSSDFNNENYEKMDEADELSARPDFSMLIYPAYLDGADGSSLAPEIHISDDIPPTFMVQTSDDTNYVGGTIIYDQALDSTNVSKVFNLFEDGGHGYGLEASSEFEVSKWPDFAEGWLIDQGILSE